MRAQAFELLVVGDDDDIVAIPGGHCRYLSGFAAPARNYVAIVVPLEGEPVLVTPPGPLNCFPELASRRSWLSRVVASPVDAWPPEDRLSSDVVSVIGELGSSRSRIGTCGTFPGMAFIAEALPSTKVIPASRSDSRGIPRDLVEQVREFKSDWEATRLVEAQRSCDVGAQAFMGAISAGASQQEAIAEAEFQAVGAGSHENLTIMSAGNDPWFWWLEGVGPGSRFRRGDLVAFEFNTRVDGYVAQVARSGVIGPPSKAQARVLETAIKSLQAMLERLELGATGGDIWDAGVSVVTAAGLEPWGRYGHGMGLCMAESFNILPGDQGQVKSGQSIMLHAGVIDRATMNSALIGDQVLIEDERVRFLSKMVLPYGMVLGA
jgi:Xaa-Pro aminopeptidase